MFDDFPKVSQKEWTEKLIADLKGKDPSVLAIYDEIEELELSSYYHNSEQLNTKATPGNYPFLRGMNRSDNHWSNGVLISIENEKEANKKALKVLNQGADLLVFKAEKNNVNWKVVLEDVLLEHIESQFIMRSVSELKELVKFVPHAPNALFNIDFLGQGLDSYEFKEIAQLFKDQQQPFCSVEGFKINRSGANASQEIAFSLSLGHHYLSELMMLGFTVDEAAACISFKLGIGGNYLFEIGKFRAFRESWARIIKAYKPQHNCSYNSHITAVSGFMNKSLSDPYTNLLRQTTETMSALCAGVDSVVILPYDHYSVKGSSDLAERMAINISLILKEESYFDKVMDAMGGSYSLEKITEKLGSSAWDLFQKLEAKGGIWNSSALELIVNSVKATAKKRIEKVTSGDQTLIGINKYPNPDKADAQWGAENSYLELPMLILENEFKTVSHA